MQRKSETPRCIYYDIDSHMIQDNIYVHTLAQLLTTAPTLKKGRFKFLVLSDLKIEPKILNLLSKIMF